MSDGCVCVGGLAVAAHGLYTVRCVCVSDRVIVGMSECESVTERGGN
jgi:hypothetical protein